MMLRILFHLSGLRKIVCILLRMLRFTHLFYRPELNIVIAKLNSTCSGTCSGIFFRITEIKLGELVCKIVNKAITKLRSLSRRFFYFVLADYENCRYRYSRNKQSDQDYYNNYYCK